MTEPLYCIQHDKTKQLYAGKARGFTSERVYAIVGTWHQITRICQEDSPRGSGPVLGVNDSTIVTYPPREAPKVE